MLIFDGHGVYKTIKCLSAKYCFECSWPPIDCEGRYWRGSNNRLNEANMHVNTPQRLFDSQNFPSVISPDCFITSKGGYGWGPTMSYYEGSILTIEWTAQHGCGNSKVDCNIVIQYMCSKRNESDPELQVRDGISTDIIPDSLSGVNATDVNVNSLYTYGLHEDFVYYQTCQRRSRNMGLFVADTQPHMGIAAVNTRQNNAGIRYGFECPEERDYYPYWHPTPWKDVAVLTDNTSRCDYYRSQSQNVLAKNYCSDPNMMFSSNGSLPGDQANCATANLAWSSQPPWGIPPPECLPTPWSRSNHHGNSLTGFLASYNWTLPVSSQEPCIADNNCNCVLRIRYNISSSEVGWDFDATKDSMSQVNPYIPLEGDEAFNLSLAVDTTRYGQTFQDRSFVFNIRPRPPGTPASAKIFNLNVKGKRGNLAQVFPSVEYDFVPEILNVKVGDYIHFQWTGCDTNPFDYDGEGFMSTDRHNIVQIPNMSVTFPASLDWINNNTPLFDTKELRQWMAYLGQTNCLSLSLLRQKNNNNENFVETDPSNCMKLNAASPYFDGGLIQMNHTGQFYYMCTRNNNFGFRQQKANINVLTGTDNGMSGSNGPSGMTSQPLGTQPATPCVSEASHFPFIALLAIMYVLGF